MQNLMIKNLMMAAIVLALSGCGNQPSGLQLAEGYVRLPPPGMKMTAGFGALTNVGSEPIELVGASSPSFGSVSLHQTRLEGGVAKMREVGSVVIEPTETLLLEPGSYHLMLMGSHVDLTAEEGIEVVLQFSDGAEQIVVLPVKHQR